MKVIILGRAKNHIAYVTKLESDQNLYVVYLHQTTFLNDKAIVFQTRYHFEFTENFSTKVFLRNMSRFIEFFFH